MKFALFTLALTSVACYTKQVSYVCNSGNSVNTCNYKFRTAFPGSTWTVQRIMGQGTWMGPNPPSCATLKQFYKDNCSMLLACHSHNDFACLPIDPISKN